MELALPSSSQDGRMWFSAVIRDITERKQAEGTIRKQRDDLVDQVRLMVGREERILEMKHEVNALLQELNRPPKYNA